MTSTTQSSLFVLLVASTALACVSCVGGDPSPLDKSLAEFAQARAAIEPASLALAEEFGRQVGQNRLYKHDLHLGSYNRADMAHLNYYLYKLTMDGALKQTGDMDAAIEVLRHATGLSDSELEATASELVEGRLVPACAAFVNSLRGVFEGDSIKDETFAKELSKRGYSDEVQNFIYGWAHYSTCSLLVNGDRAPLIRRIPSRLEDQRRIAAKRLARMQKAQ